MENCVLILIVDIYLFLLKSRFYGTSEFQFGEALGEMLEKGEIKREDFILQTKIPAFSTKKDFMKRWDETWGHVKRVGHIDLFAIHCSSSPRTYKYIFDNGEDSIINVGKIM